MWYKIYYKLKTSELNSQRSMLISGADEIEAKDQAIERLTAQWGEKSFKIKKIELVEKA